MKNQNFPWLVAITLVFLSFTAGFFLGRTGSSGDVVLSEVSTVARHSGPAPTVETTGEPEIIYPLNINTASAEELTSLPGIGPALAKRILSYREQLGTFSRPEELLNVEGIGQGKLEAILDLITTGG